MGQLHLHEVYISYDGPRLFSCINESGVHYFGLFVDEDDVAETYLYAPARQARFWAVRSGQVPLRSAFVEPTDGGVFIVRSSLVDASEDLVTWHPAGTITDEWLPDPEARLAIPTETMQPLDSGAVSLDASALGRTLAAFELDAQYLTTEFPLRSLGDILRVVQESVDSFAQVVKDKKTNRGAVQQDILEETELTFFATRAASFAFVVAATPKSRLFEDPLLGNSIGLLLDVMRVGSLEESLRDTLEQLHPRALSKYRDLLEVLEDVDSGLTAILAMPDGTSRESRLDRDGVATSLALVRMKMQPEIVTLTIEAILVGVNARTHTFELLDETTNQKYAGKAVQPARDRLLGLTIGYRYNATLMREADTHPLTGEIGYKYRLQAITETG